MFAFLIFFRISFFLVHLTVVIRDVISKLCCVARVIMCDEVFRFIIGPRVFIIFALVFILIIMNSSKEQFGIGIYKHDCFEGFAQKMVEHLYAHS